MKKEISLRDRLGDEYNKRGELLSQMSSHERALVYYGKAIDANGNNAKCFFNRASCYFALEKFHLSIEDSLKAIAFIPRCLKSHQNICACRLAMMDVSGSCKAIRKCRLLSSDIEDAIDTLKKGCLRRDADTVMTKFPYCRYCNYL